MRTLSPFAEPDFCRTSGWPLPEPGVPTTKSAVSSARSCTVPSLPVITSWPPALMVTLPPRFDEAPTDELSRPSTSSRNAVKSAMVAPFASAPATAVALKAKVFEPRSLPPFSTPEMVIVLGFTLESNASTEPPAPSDM